MVADLDFILDDDRPVGLLCDGCKTLATFPDTRGRCDDESVDAFADAILCFVQDHHAHGNIRICFLNGDGTVELSPHTLELNPNIAQA